MKNLFFNFLLFFMLLSPANTYAEDAGFNRWIQELRKEALLKGISEHTFDSAFKNVSYNEKIIKFDQAQAEFTYNIWDYLDRMVSGAKINHGKVMLKKHRKLLDEISKKYGVPGQYIMAFWGMETNFGVNFGGFYVIESLATLAYDTRRSDFFRRELLTALKILEEGHVKPENMKGSWAGAMGNFQFMPSTYMQYAVDYDKDGSKDIWLSLPDSFASAANYLNKIGWKPGQRWGREVFLPKNLSWVKLNSRLTRTTDEWKKAEIIPAHGKNFLGGKMEATMIFPGGYKGPIFLTYHNFDVIKRWNNSIFYALAVGYFSDRLMSGPEIKTKRQNIYMPTRAEISEMQKLLAELGYYDGKIDGIVGRGMRAALSKAQRNYKLPIDGYPSKTLANRMRKDVKLINANN